MKKFNHLDYNYHKLDNWWTNKSNKKLIKLQKTHNISIGLHLEFNDTNFEEQIQNQYNKFIQIFDFKPSHIDIHKPSRLTEENIAIQNFLCKNNLSCRNLNYDFTQVKMTSNEVINGTNMSFVELNKLIKKFIDEQSYEILFHPGTLDKNCKSSLNKNRELDIIKIVKLNEILEENQIKLVSYVDL